MPAHPPPLPQNEAAGLRAGRLAPQCSWLTSLGLFSPANIGMDLNSPVVRGCICETPYKFTGTIDSVTIELK